MVPMRDKKGVQATHEPERRAPARRGVACPECADLEIGAPSSRFMVPMRARIGVMATHEPRPLTPSLSSAGEEGVRRTGEGDRHWFMVPMHGLEAVEATCEPERRTPAARGVACPECAGLAIGAPSPRFKVPMRAKNGLEAAHEPRGRAGVPPGPAAKPTADLSSRSR